MPIAATDLKLYGAANHAEDDVSTQGGAIATAKKLEFTQFSANATPHVKSDGADTRTGTVHYRTAAGARASQPFTLDGTNEVSLGVTAERIIKVVLDSSSGSRTVSLLQGSGGTVRATLGPNITECRLLFADAASESGSTTRYEKGFFKNEHGSLTLSSAAVTLTADPSAVIRVGCAPSKGDTATATNRKTAPASVTFVDDSVAQSVPTGALAAGETIGVWWELALGADAPAAKSTLTTQLAGTTI